MDFILSDQNFSVYLFVINNKALHDYQQFNISYEEITDKEMIGRGRFGVVYK